MNLVEEEKNYLILKIYLIWTKYKKKKLFRINSRNLFFALKSFILQFFDKSVPNRT